MLHRKIALVACAALLGISAIAADDTGNLGTNSSYGVSNSTSRSRSNRSTSANGLDSGLDSFTDFGGSSRTNGRSSRRGTPTPKGGAKSTGTPGPGGKGTPGTGKTLTSTAGKKPASTGKGSTGDAHAATNIEFKMKADTNTNVLYVEGMGGQPTMNILATEGDEVVTRVFYMNGRATPFKTFSVALKYDPAILEPLGIDDSDLATMLDGDSSAHVDSKRGVITYKATLREVRTDPAFTVFKVQWKALTPTSDATIAFINNDKYRSNVLDDNDHNMLIQRDETGEVESSEKAGLVDAAISVIPSAKTARSMAEDEGSFSAISLANNISQGTAEGGIVLELRPRRPHIKVGEDFLVDVLYSNPKHAELDTVKLKLRFDPSVLRVIDYDDDNWITQGVNIYDGDYHDDLPFDYHRTNSASNETGIIQYDMGFAGRERIPVKGTIATIRMRAVAAAASTSIEFLYDDTPDAEPQTAITFLGFNLVGAPGQRSTALRNVDLSISSL